jgi:hypothetical protein
MSAGSQDLHFESPRHCDRRRWHSIFLSTDNLSATIFDDLLSRLDILRRTNITIPQFPFDRGGERAGYGPPELVDDEDMPELTDDSDFEDMPAPADDALVKRCAHRE